MNKTLICVDVRPPRNKWEAARDGVTYFDTKTRRLFDVFVNTRQSRLPFDTLLHEFMHVVYAMTKKAPAKENIEELRVCRAVEAAMSILLPSGKRRKEREHD